MKEYPTLGSAEATHARAKVVFVPDGQNIGAGRTKPCLKCAVMGRQKYPTSGNGR
jgi:hypothetical protein